MRTGQADPAPCAVRLPYLAGLDGLRAVAVIGVLLYHADHLLRGGFLGVETFFVLSGFLITALLLAEWREQERISLTAFWLRRARRLLPALFLVLLGTMLLTIGLHIASVTTIGIDLLAALGYVMNWRLIASGQAYFDPLVRPSLLQHLWSLAIEEQFYLLWPLLFGIGMRYVRRSGVLALVIAGAVASIALMVTLYQPGADPSRVYYGTDTRASALLLGCALGLLWAPWRTARTESRTIGRVLDTVGLIALGGLLLGYVWLYESHLLLYRGGFTLTAIATAGVIAAVSHPGTRLVSTVLGMQPLCWIGQRSYGLYLWHWPVFLVTRPLIDVPLAGWPLLVMRLTVVAVLAELSYRYVEVPVQRGALAPVWKWIQATGRGWFVRSRRGGLQHGLSSRPAWVIVMMSLSVLLTGGIATTGIVAETVTSLAPVDRPSMLAAPTDRTPSARPLVAPTATSPTVSHDPSATVVPVTATHTTAAAAMPTPAPPTPTVVTLAPFDPALAATLQQILDEMVADSYIPGTVLSVSVPGHEPWTGASGVADRQTQRPMEPTTVVRIGSISKMFLTVVVLQLAEEGVLELDAPVATYLPDLLPQGEAITVRHLLQHRSGLYDYLEDGPFVIQAYQNPARAWSPAELVAHANQFALAFPPGAEGRWDYSNTNYVILGMVVEEVTGNPLATELRQRILDPLGLTQTFTLSTEPMPETAARSYAGTTDRTEVAMSFAFAAANLVSTAEDMRHFVEALTQGELLRPESREQMYAFVNGYGQYNMPELEYGLGIMRNRLPVGPDANSEPRPASASRVVGHIGGFGGFRSAVWSAPEGGITIALAMNQAAIDPNILAQRVFDAILTAQGR
jgi:peptidoglycan/LPS O-acetylase OafA/YrhL/CubicO group peptidase (beta-lactamase class C family)